jgi:hypothetical protein
MNGKHGFVHGPHDEKLKKIESFMKWLEDWSDDLARPSRGFTQAEQDHRFISRQCYQDLRLSIRGFVGMCRSYTAPRMPWDGVPIWPAFFNQDTLEHHFANLRRAEGDGRNPNLAAAIRGAWSGTTIRLFRDTKSNSGGAPIELMNQPLEKRRKTPKSATLATRPKST